MTKNKLAPKQQRFVEEYPKDLNGKQAAIRAGYSARSAEVHASRLLSNAKVQSALQAILKARADKAELTAADLLAEIDILATSNIAQIFDFDSDGGIVLKAGKDIPDRARRCIASLELTTDKSGQPIVKVRLWDKVAAQRLAGQHRGMFTEKHEHTGEGGGPIQIKTIEVVRPIAKEGKVDG